MGKGANSASDKGWFIALGNQTAGCIMLQFKRGTGDNFTAASRESIATVNDGAWHHATVTAVTSSTNSGDIDINIYIDGTLSQGSQTTLGTYDGTSTSNLSIGCRGVPAGPSGYLTADVAEVGIWGVILSTSEIGSLSKAIRPPNVHPMSLVAYFPLVRDLVELKGGLGLTNTNSVTVSAHPRIY